MRLKVVDVNRILIITILFVVSNSISAQSNSNKASYTNQKLSDVLIELALAYNVDLVLNHEELYQNRISIELSGESLQADVSRVLKGRDIEIEIVEDQLLLHPFPRVYGYVYDEENSETLIGASIYNPESRKGVYTNDYGYFSIVVPYKSNLEFSYIGYTSEIIRTEYHKGPLTIQLKSDLELNEVIVVQSLQESGSENKGMEMSILDHDLKTVFATGGVTDVFQYLYKQSGVHTAADGLGGIHVRGGGSDQNIILYDGVELFNPTHSLGMFSIFNAEGINSAKFYKSGLPVKYANKASSVIDIRMKEGDLGDWSGSFNTNTLATGFAIDGPIVKNKTGIAIMGRRSHVDPFFKSISTRKKNDIGSEGQSNHYFYDVNAKLHHVIGSQDRVYLTYFKSNDVYDDETLEFGDFDDFYFDDILRFNLDWGNEMGALRWNHLVGTKAFSNLTLYSTQFKYSSYTLADQYTEYFDTGETELSKIATGVISKIKEIGARYEWDIYLDDQKKLNLGGGFLKRNYDPGFISYEDEAIINSNEDVVDIIEDQGSYADNSYNSNEVFAFIDYKWDLTEALNLNAGLRYTLFDGINIIDAIDFTHHLLQGSFSLNYRTQSDLQFILAYDHVKQPLHLITSSDVGFPNDLWVPSTELIDPISSDQIDLSIHWNIDESWKIKASSYYKLQSNLIRYQDNISLPTIGDNISTFWEDEVLVGEGRSYGINTDLSYRSDQFRTDLSYSLSKSQRRFIGLNNDDFFPYLFDQPHKVNLNSYYKLNSNLWVYANFTYNSGNAQTLYITDRPFSSLDIYADAGFLTSVGVNTERLSDYHRLDLGVRMSWGSETLHHDFTIGIQNVYNRKNPYYSYVIEDSVFPEENGLNARNGLPLLPTLSYRIGFGK